MGRVKQRKTRRWNSTSIQRWSTWKNQRVNWTWYKHRFEFYFIFFILLDFCLRRIKSWLAKIAEEALWWSVIFLHIALHFECWFNKNSLLLCYFSLAVFACAERKRNRPSRTKEFFKGYENLWWNSQKYADFPHTDFTKHFHSSNRSSIFIALSINKSLTDVSC